MTTALRGLLSVDRGPGFPDRRPFRSGPDTNSFQGDGWRWTLSLLLPNWLLWRCRGHWAPAVAPFTLDMLVLNRAQRLACYDEWHLTQLALEAEVGELPPRSEDDELFLLPSRLYADYWPFGRIAYHLARTPTYAGRLLARALAGAGRSGHLRRVLLALVVAAGLVLLASAFVGDPAGRMHSGSVGPTPVTTEYVPAPAGPPVPDWPVGDDATPTPERRFPQ